ncbi:hypothetical protein [Burkholderia cenocepacia]|uniref:Membrane protein n=2 Tax=Pseudomonadota TaxID=1224 RepID=B4EQP4_BURCJ|nr:hypothetical protein [Burkholderia cenocepacia]KIS46003.1 putative membrane protein [Burkholderia cepacia]KKI81729.1 hypothetical protein WQ49_14395 [Burkholderia cenocepacia]ONR59031.1 hypothetical protein A8E17_15820 [Burkholderia cenocepacia]ONR61395.1 hypothetical protein A8E18_35860 [Burkholderia cenocepacia]ONR82606.1 hypothetical protein A8E25_32665 [Burkholderia cenocepacia]
MKRPNYRSALLAACVAVAAFLVTACFGHRAWPIVAATLLAIPLASLFVKATNRWRRQQAVDRPSVTITEATVWELRLNDVPAAEVPEHVVRRIEHELAQERQWDLRVASILSYAGAVLCQLAYTALCIPLAIFAFAGLSWATNPAGFAHLARQILNASETELRAVVDGLAWTAIGFSGMVLVMWHAFGGRTRIPDHYDEAWHEEIRLAARIAPRGEFTLHLSGQVVPAGFRVTRGPRLTVHYWPNSRRSSPNRHDVA